MSIRNRSLIALALLSTLLGGCASIPKSACQSGDWYDIGMRDGNSGRAEDRFLDHAQACAKHGLPANREHWLMGRTRGLEQYCTTRNGLAVGENNSRYGGVCPAVLEQGFLHGYDVGRDLSQARARLSALDNEMQRIRQRLEPRDDARKNDRDKSSTEKPLSDTERNTLAYQLGVHAAQREQLIHEVSDIEYVARQL
jgi:Protein of unknown function (DUF2799)